MLRQIKI